jgi:pullulanase/glycogen debranching enzyme/tetratricopeptide (TPR) repeat protein
MDCKERSVTLEVLLDALAELSGDPELLKLTQDPSTRPEDRVEQVLQRFMEPQKVVLFVEDYHRLEGLGEHHRLDELLIQAARHCEQTKIILVGRVRPGVLDNHKLHGAFLEHPMEGLGEEYTREFVNIPNLTDEQAHKIWKQCASGTPIAMSIFGQEVNKRSLSDLLALPIWGIANTKQQWLDPVVENLTLSERACLQAASVFSADIPHSALAYIYDRDDLQSAMDGLLDKGLLVHKPGSDRYAVWHDIIRDYVSDRQIIPLARDEFEQRLVEYYAQFVLENLYKPEQLRSESANILGAMKSWRRKQRGALRPVTELLQLMLGVEEHEALKIALSTGELAHRSGDVKWAAEIYNEVSDLARRKNYVVELAKALLQLSFLAELEGDNSLAMRYLTEGLQAARRSEDHTIVPDIVGKLAYLYSSQNEHEKAYALYREERDNLSGAPLAHLLCGIVPRLFEMSSFDEAWDCIQKAQNILREESNVGAFAYTWRLQGDWYWKQDKLEKAEESFKEEEQLRRSAVEGDEQEVKYLFEIMWKQVRFFQETNQLDKARQCMARFKAIQSIPAWLMPQLLGHEAVLLVALGDYRGASQRCQEAMTIYREQGILGGSAWIQRIQGDIQAAQGKFKEAVKIYEAGLELRSRLGESERTAEGLEHLAEFYIRQMHDVEQACKYLERAQQQFQRVDAREASALGERLRTLRQNSRFAAGSGQRSRLQSTSRMRFLKDMATNTKAALCGNLRLAQAHWVTRDTIAWKLESIPTDATFQLHYSFDADLRATATGIQGGQVLPLTYDPAGLEDRITTKFPHLRQYHALKLDAMDLERVSGILKGQLAVTAVGDDGSLLDATALQIPGVLDDLYTYDGPLGVTYYDQVPTLHLWAPTAQSVTLHLFDDSNLDTSSTVFPMSLDPNTGVWQVRGTTDWTLKYYLYEVEVFVLSTGRVEKNLVTDPYSISLSMNSQRSQIVNLDSPRLKPAGWDELQKPCLAGPDDIVIYELHLRDFSIFDETVLEPYRGTFMAFTQTKSNGMCHLRHLAEAGLTHVHLLPVFDIATINEDKAERVEPDHRILAQYGPDSTEQQALIALTRERDGYDWGYNPYHYAVPEGSYSTDPDSPARILEFRSMVQALNKAGLRVIMDVVYNHTYASGQDEKSVLDRIVPGYYYRLNQNGEVETSTCCPNTATEHAMMEKLMIDTLLIWATAYKVDGFRFDLMGHHMKDNVTKVRDTLHGLTIVDDGVDGSSVYIYGEGWDFGEVADNARGVNATQLNLFGTGIGTFNDRMRDAVRGDRSFTGQQEQGFITGLYYDPNEVVPLSKAEQLAQLLWYADLIRLGLAGNLSDYTQ